MISTHAPLAGRDVDTLGELYKLWISTHAPLAGRDRKLYEIIDGLFGISTHAPLAGRDR